MTLPQAGTNQALFTTLVWFCFEGVEIAKVWRLSVDWCYHYPFDGELAGVLISGSSLKSCDTSMPFDKAGDRNVTSDL